MLGFGDECTLKVEGLWQATERMHFPTATLGACVSRVVHCTTRNQATFSCPQASTRSAYRRAAAAQAKATKAIATLLRALTWLPLRLLRVFLGTYASSNEDVRRAGLVADVNAMALAVAAILLLTSRATFQKAEDTVKNQAWANLLRDNPSAACATLNQQPFVGRTLPKFHFVWLRPEAVGFSEYHTVPVNGSDRRQVLGVLRALSDCKAFSMGISTVYRNSEVCYAAADEHHSMDRIINSTEGPYMDDTSWASLDVITPEDLYNTTGATRSPAGVSCMEGSSAGVLNQTLVEGACYNPSPPVGDPDFPGDLGFPQGMQIVRWVDRFGKGIYLGVSCNSTLAEPSPELQRCINTSAQLANVRAAWTDFAHSQPPVMVPLKGSEQGAFCPANRTLEIAFYPPSPYRCRYGAQLSNLSLLNDEVDALKGIPQFAYFQCLSYDELFGVYVGTVGVLMTVAMATTALYVTDVARPMLLAGCGAWSWDAAAQSIEKTDQTVCERRCMHVIKVVDVVLRCTAGCAAGSALGMLFMYAPWLIFLNHQAQACKPA